MKWLEYLKKNVLLKYPNVIGFSNQLMPKEKDGKEIKDTQVIRILVHPKVPEKSLTKKEIIPSVIKIREGWKFWKNIEIETDVVDRGEPRAPPPDVTVKTVKKSTVDKTIKFRPVELGVAIGHYQISAGSLGMLYNKNGETFAGTNAHVGTPDPNKSVGSITETRILNPAPYHDPSKPQENVIGHYIWHKRIKFITEMSSCSLSNFIASVLNHIYKWCGRKTRFRTIAVTSVNHIDFMVYKPCVDHSLTIADDSIDLTKAKFIGHLFAGSDSIGIICKVKYIIAEGYTPLTPYTTEIKRGSRVKGCSFWCHFETEVEDPSATVQVNYGNGIALFEDVIFVKNDGTIRGGYSGSGFYEI